MKWGARAAAAIALLAVAVAPASADVYQLTDGDRITGKTLSSRGKSFLVQTPYGRLTIPRARVERVIHDDGSEEPINPRPVPSPTPEPQPPASLLLIVTGSTFWYAWDPKTEPADTTLRLKLSLDEEPLATLADFRLDPGELGRATLNTFSFAPEDLKPEAAEGVTLKPAEVRPGRIVLRLDLVSPRQGKLRLRLAYQVNEGSAEAPALRDVAEAVTSVELLPGKTTFVRVRQDRGQMEFSGTLGRKRMKKVETFRIEAAPE